MIILGIVIGIAIVFVIYSFIALPLAWAIVALLGFILLFAAVGFAAFADSLFRGF